MNKYANLPNKIKVRISKGKSGSLIAELVDFDAFTEADGWRELDYCINDLIFSYFDVPETVRDLIRYSSQPKLGKDKPNLNEDEIVFFKYFWSEARHVFS